eukprot:2835661-Rhodomonas_salina.2
MSGLGEGVLEVQSCQRLWIIGPCSKCQMSGIVDGWRMARISGTAGRVPWIAGRGPGNADAHTRKLRRNGSLRWVKRYVITGHRIAAGCHSDAMCQYRTWRSKRMGGYHTLYVSTGHGVASA